MVEFEEKSNGEENVKIDTCERGSEFRKRDDTPEEAGTALDNKRDEFLKIYGWRPSFKCGCKTDDKLLAKPNCEVVTTREISNELTNDVNVCVGVKRKKVEFEETSNGKEDATIDTCDCSSKVRKSIPGVTKSGNRWRARMQHPQLKIEISLGRYDNQEEAALAVTKKKTEFLEMFKDDSNTNVKTSRDNFEGRKLPRGVRRRGYRRWAARIYDPKLKRVISLGCYDTPEEAATALDNKRGEFLKLYGCRQYVKRGCKTDDKLLEEPNCGVVTTREILDESNREVVVTTSDILDKLTSDLNVAAGARKLGECDSEFDDEILEEPKHDVVTTSESWSKLAGGLMVRAGVKKLKSGEWCETTKWLDTFDNAEEDVGFFNKSKAELAAEREKADRGSLNSCATSDLGSDNSNISSINDEPNVGALVANFSNKLEYTFVHSSHVSVNEPENSDSVDISKRSMISIGNEQKRGYASEFDEAMSLGIINEYGQLVGMYSELDKQMEFSLTGEDVADIGGC